MRKYSARQKIWAVVLTLVMVIGMLPKFSMPVSAAGTEASLAVCDKVADPETLNNWQGYYGEESLLPDGSTGISTWKAGGVWTDKSVFADEQTAAEAGLNVSLNDSNDFLVSLSALASNQEIVGQSSAPTDTMLVLDLSNSMDNSRSVPDMIAAANETIDALLKMNVNNRVGVVLYSGNSRQDDSEKSTATVILPLDRYTTTTTTTENGVVKYQYLTVTGTNDTTVSVAAGTLNSQNVKPTGSKNTIGGTYIQNGLYQAYEQFSSKDDKGIVKTGTQAGTQRTPILILMSDGAPTAATTVYYDVDKSDTGDGTTTTNQITFLTQLTAAWVKGSVSAHYNNTEAKFYTLGLGTSGDANATAVLYPAGSNTTLQTYWTNFNTGSEDGDTVTITQGSNQQGPGGGQQGLSLTYRSMAETVGRNYVDGYWSASDSGDMIAVFQEIVDEIGLQSAYSATLVQGGDADLGGYVTIEDELGSMMVVKDVKGILLGDTLFAGSELAKSMKEGLLGSSSNPKDYGIEFVNTVKERIGIEDTSVAQNLIRSAYHSGQLSYTSDAEYSNYIGWYGDKDNNYLGFWEESYGYDMTNAPDGAVYINQSYGFLGGTADTEDAADMMHVVVMVRTEIANGHQTILFKVPSSLIPMVTYTVELEGDALEADAAAKLTVKENDPIRLIYEVGLPSDVNNVNLEQKVQEYLAKEGSNHIHKDGYGNYVFYANSWGAVDEVAPYIPGMTDAEKQALTASVAESHFIPNTANERFYILEDSIVYVKNGDSYTEASSIVDGNTYYFARPIVTVTGADGAATVQTQYEALYPNTVANDDNFYQAEDGTLMVKAGTIRQHLSNLALEKSDNATETIGYSDSLWVYVPGSDAEDYNVYSFLGNNGKLTVAPATGLKVTKNVTEYAEGDSATTKFRITVTLSQAEENAVVTDANGDPLPEGTWSTDDNKTFVLNLAHGESVYITGLTAGTTYNVAEQDEDYTTTFVKQNGTIVAGAVQAATVNNAAVKEGNLYITKEVIHANGGTSFPATYEFEFEVTFVDKNSKPIANTTFQLENNYQPELTELTTDENGVMTGKLRHGETVYIKEIPADATVTVKEINLPADGNYQLAGYRSRNQSGAEADNDGVVTIVSEANATVVVTNTYTPKTTTVDLNIDGIKNFVVKGNQAAQQAGSFTFVVEKWNGQAWEAVSGKTVTLEYAAGEGNSAKTFAIDNVLEGITYDEAGVYTYQVREVIGDVANVTYDRTLYTFTVTVTDVNGQLTAVVTDLHNNVIADGVYEVEFNNSLYNAPVSIDIEKAVTNNSGDSSVSKAGFNFKAVRTDENWAPLAGDDASELTVTSDGAGEARVTATYNDPGTYYYLLSEEIPTEAVLNAATGKYELKGWIYDSKQYKVTVTVAYEIVEGVTTQNLVATMDIEGTAYGDNAKVTFTNVYDPDDATVDLKTRPVLNKILTGRDLKEGEFTFAIFENGQASHTRTQGAKAIGTNSALVDGVSTVAFEPALTFDKVGKYEYDVVEILPDGAVLDETIGKYTLNGVTYDLTVLDLVVEVTLDKGTGKLVEKHYFEDAVDDASFKNTYTVQSTEVVIEGLKTLEVESGFKSLNAGDYTFGLYDEDGEKIGETTNLANGTFKFDAVEYDGDDIGKTYTYTVKEIAPDGTTDGSCSAGGVNYSNGSFTVTVKVVDNGDGTLKTEVNGNSADIIKFVNKYSSTPASVTLSGKKTLYSRDLTADEFKFELYTADANFENRTLKMNTITHDEDGEFSISLGTLNMGYHYFVIKEVIGDATGIHYDASEYHITVQVIDQGNGQMSAIVSTYHPGKPSEVNPDIVFNNSYRPEDGELTLSGSKTYTGGKTLTDDVFYVGLYEGTDELQSVPVKADGSFTFAALEYTADDIGQTYTYTVKEIYTEQTVTNTDGSKTEYDSAVYTVKVTVADTDKDGSLEITYTVDNVSNGPITFTNKHIPATITYSLQAEKTYEKGLKGNDFRFTLVSADGKTNENQEKYNDVQGVITFDPITFSAAGEYKFTVTEKKEGILSFIRPSEAEYEVTITVVNENGVLRVSNVAVVNTKNTGESELEFINTYIMDGEGEVTLRGTKALTGDRTTVNAEEFEFGLYDADGDLVESVKNDASGNFQFSTLKFDEEDTVVNGQKQYTYTVKEIAGNNARYDYDETVYTVVITVKDNDQGGITVTYTVNGAANGAITFTNKYTNPTPVTYAPEAIKRYNRPLAGDEFTFKLEGEIAGVKVEQTKKNQEGGAVKFDALSFPEAGTYTFTVKEIEKVLGFIQYSAAEHTIVVKVIDTNGVLSIESVTINEDAEGTIEFTNAYIMDGEGEVTLRGTKTLTGDRTTVNAEEFEFGLYDAEGNLVETVKNDANGNFQFSTLKFDEEDTVVNGQKQYSYTVKEIIGNDPYVTYDDAVYNIVITVKDNNEGGVDVSYTVNGTANGAIAFENTFTNPDPVTVTIDVTKTVENKTQPGIGAEDFEVLLYEGEALRGTAKTGKAGKAGFQITYGLEDVGKTVTYKVMEKKGKVAGVTYDETVHTVKVTVAAKEDGALYTVINDKEAGSVAVSFKNIYEKPATPVTGDNFPVLLVGSLLLISAAAFVALLMTKKKGGKYAA